MLGINKQRIKHQKNNLLTTLLTTLLFLPFCSSQNAYAGYLIGGGIDDITGPAAEVGMMGYAEAGQKTAGLRMRVFARAFVFVDQDSGKRMAFVSADLGQLFQSIKQGVVKKLKEKGYGERYFDDNVMLSATHTHSGPGGYAHYTLFNISTYGFSQENYNHIVEGITNAIIKADKNAKEAVIFSNQGFLYNASKNRSPEAFYSNPFRFRKQLAGEETDKKMYLLRFQQGSGREIGMINWFADHGVSMSKHNRLITGDNKGYASYLFERHMHSNYKAKAPFIAAFAQSNEGDVSPNIFDFGNGKHDARRVEIIGKRQYKKARELYESANLPIEGKIDYRLQYIDMSNYKIQPEFANGHHQTTCTSALGVSFTKGTSDGSGLVISKMLLEATGEILTSPTIEDKACHAPKDIFLATGHFKPNPWLPNIVPVQIFQLGSIAIAGVPGEFTSIAGERLKLTIKKALGDQIQTVVIAGLSNSYTGYITTHEEYEKQDYEGGFTVYGPWTLAAYQQAFQQVASDLAANRSTPHGPNPLDLSGTQKTMQTGVVYDNVPLGYEFGQVVSHRDAEASYKAGQTVNVTFWGGHPKNNFHSSVKNHHESFLYVQRFSDGKWHSIYNDNDWNTTYRWMRYGLDASHIQILWKIPKKIKPGTYRIIHKGYYKNGFSRKIFPYEGSSRTFQVTG